MTDVLFGLEDVDVEWAHLGDGYPQLVEDVLDMRAEERFPGLQTGAPSMRMR